MLAPSSASLQLRRRELPQVPTPVHHTNKLPYDKARTVADLRSTCNRAPCDLTWDDVHDDMKHLRLAVGVGGALSKTAVSY
eukprot:6213314-Pleurochrysis_carterae.AAC.4